MIEYEKINVEDKEEIIRLYEGYLNEGKSVGNLINLYFEKGQYYGYKAINDDDMVGCFTFVKGIEFTYPQPELEKELCKVTRGERVETVDTLVVLPKYRRAGIAKELALRNLEGLQERGTNIYVVEIWIYPDGSIPARKIYESMGEVVYSKKIPDFYKDLYKYGLKCPICGKLCKCGALVEAIKIDR
ncbi:MAG: GNAT family N-acetyltransferase [Lachnospiraceae bacterium]|nr:GNAT family N-acetyltransferase [Lachnospiraceae bacterium]